MHDDEREWRRPRARMRRGDIRVAVLVALSDAPGHGYEIIQRLADKSGGLWQPSPGSVYPTLQLLEDEGLVRGTERDGKRIYELTDAGREEVSRRVAEGAGEPWTAPGRFGTGTGQLRGAMAQLHLAVKQVTMAGTPAQVEHAIAILNEARKRLYQMLSED
jgi:DNA-binding PadR family transcriptional regulator